MLTITSMFVETLIDIKYIVCDLLVVLLILDQEVYTDTP